MVKGGGDFEIFFSSMSVALLGIIVYNVITAFSLRNLLKRFGFLKISRILDRPRAQASPVPQAKTHKNPHKTVPCKNCQKAI